LRLGDALAGESCAVGDVETLDDEGKMAVTRQDIHNRRCQRFAPAAQARRQGHVRRADAGRVAGAEPRATDRARHEAGDELVGDSTAITSYANVMKGVVVKLTKVLEDGRQQLVGLELAPDPAGRLDGEEHQVTAEAALRRRGFASCRGALSSR